MRLAEAGPLAAWRAAVVAPARGVVLEIAAGTGLTFAHYTGQAVVVASDPDEDMLRRARVRAPGAAAQILLVAADAEALPFRGGTFDAAVVNLAMCTIPRPSAALAELGRVVRSAGAVRLLEHVLVEQPIIRRLQRWATPLWRRVAGGCRLDRDTVGAVECSGLLVERVTSHAGGYVVEIIAQVPEASRSFPASEDAQRHR